MLGFTTAPLIRPLRRREQGDVFLLLFALANAGGVIAYVPFLTLLLPPKITALAGNADVEWLGLATLVGAVAASISNIGAGWGSDLFGPRRRWVWAGLILTIASYGLLHAAASPIAIIVAVALYQVALNTLLSPLAAWAADVVPDRRKGLLGGMLAAAPLLAAGAGLIVTLPALSEGWVRMAAICALVLLFTLPLLMLRTPVRTIRPITSPQPPNPARAHGDFALLWASRLFVQVAGNVLFGYLFYYFQSLPEAPQEAGVARLSATAVVLAFPIALAFGFLSDRIGRRKPFLILAAGAAAAGLSVMATSAGLFASASGYILFECGITIFLALHSSYAMQLLPSSSRRGRDLGLINLANTLPAIVAPLLAIWLVPGRGFGPLLALLTGLVLLAALCILFVRQDQQAA